MTSSADLKAIFSEARPLIEQQLDLAEEVAALRDAATARGLDWSQIKALLKAQIQDERDETGNGKRVHKIVSKAENASAYAGMLGLANMNEQNFSSPSYAEAKGRGETDTQESVQSVSPAAPSEPAVRSSDESTAPNPEQPATPLPQADRAPEATPSHASGDASSDDGDFEPPAFLKRDHRDAGPIPSFMDRRHELEGSA